MEIARKNTARAGLQIDFRQGNSSDMLFKENTFDFTFCQADFKNFSEPVKAIAEVYRVWCPSGLSITADLRRDASAEDIEREIQAMGLGHINEFMVRWTFKNMLLKNAYRADEMRSIVAQTPFGQCKIDIDGISLQVWLKK